MEEKKFDPWQFVGFFLIALILTWMLYNQPIKIEDDHLGIHKWPQELCQTAYFCSIIIQLRG